MRKLSRTNYFKTLPAMRMFYGSEDTPNWRPLPIKEMAYGGRMDDTEYRKRLSEVAEWTIPKLSATDIKESKKRGRGRPSAEERYQEAHEEMFLDIYQGINPTHPPELLRTKNRSCVCEDCGDTCPNGRKKEKKLYETSGKRNWRERCVTCNRNKNPFTGKFDMTPSEAPHVWTTYLRETKGLYKTTGNEARNKPDSKEEI